MFRFLLIWDVKFEYSEYVSFILCYAIDDIHLCYYGKLYIQIPMKYEYYLLQYNNLLVDFYVYEEMTLLRRSSPTQL